MTEEATQPPPNLGTILGAAMTSKGGMFGVITALVISALSVGWGGVQQCAAWIGPKVDKVVETHLESVKKTDSAVETMVKSQSEIVDIQQKQAKAIDGIHDAVRGVQKTNEDIGQALKKLSERQP